MSLEYIRRTYGVPAKRGARVQIAYRGGLYEGRITRANGPHVVVAPDRWPGERLIYHPTDIKYR